MKQTAQVLNFSEALLLTERGQQIAEAKRRNRAALITQKPVRMSCCHDGVWRVLEEAPKFRRGGFTGTTDFDAGLEWWAKNHESIINKKDRGHFR